MKIEYPKFLYKEGAEPVIVHSPQEHEAMIGWAESPESVSATQVIQEKVEPKRRGRPPKAR